MIPAKYLSILLSDRFVRRDMKVKRRLNDIMQQTLEPIRERRLMFEKDKTEVLNMLKKGSESARPIAAETLNKLKEVFTLIY